MTDTQQRPGRDVLNPPALSTPIATFLGVLVVVLITIIAALLLQRDQVTPTINADIDLAPTSGGPNTRVLVSGSGFPEGVIVDIYLESSGPTGGARRELVGETVSNLNGNISTSFDIPAEWEDGSPITEGPLLITAISDDENTRAVSGFFFSIPDFDGTGGPFAPTIAVSPDSGSGGTQVSVRVAGFPAGERVTVRLGPANINLDLIDPDENIIAGLEPRSYGEAITDDDGEAEFVFFMPDQWTNGDTIDDEQIVIVVANDGFTTFVGAGFDYLPDRPPARLEQAQIQPTPEPTATQPPDASIAISPSSGGPATVVTITGQNFPAERSVDIRLGQPNVGATDQVYAQAQTDDDGSFEAEITLPADWPDGSPIGTGTISIIAEGPNNTSASSNFSYEAPDPDPNPSISFNRNSGFPGTRVTVDGFDFPADADVELLLRRDDGEVFGSYDQDETDEDGEVRLRFTVPDDWPDGEEVDDDDIDVIVRVDDSDIQAERSFDVDLRDEDEDDDSGDPAISISPTTGSAGTTVSISGEDFTSSARVEVRLRIDNITYSTIYAAGDVNSQGEFALSFEMPAVLPDGEPITDEDVIIVVSTTDGDISERAGFLYEIDEEEDPTATPTSTATATETATPTATETTSATTTATATQTPSSTPSATPSITVTTTITPTTTQTRTPTPSVTPCVSDDGTPCPTPSPTITPTACISDEGTPCPTLTPTATATPEP